MYQKEGKKMNSKTKKALKAAGFQLYGDLVKINDSLYPMPLVQGNTKLGEKVWHASTFPTNESVEVVLKDGRTASAAGTCPMFCKGCYGTTGNYNYSTTKYWLIMRTELLRKYPDVYFQLVKIQLENEDIERFRIHATGDFITGEAKKYYDLLKEFPHIKAWTYTKVTNDSDIELLDSLPNCNVVKSIIHGYGFNFGHVPYIANVYYYLKRNNKSVYICRCGIDKNQHCSNCDGCSDHEYVLFLEHSTGYKAESDYGFQKMIDLIESQKEGK